MTKSKARWKLIGNYPITEYQCGARAGDRFRLRQVIVVRDHADKPTRVVHPAGEIWTVLKGAAEPPVVVWLQQPDGHRHTGYDDAGFWDWLERVDENAT
jgi:hypothetical protein